MKYFLCEYIFYHDTIGDPCAVCGTGIFSLGMMQFSIGEFFIVLKNKHLRINKPPVP